MAAVMVVTLFTATARTAFIASLDTVSVAAFVLLLSIALLSIRALGLIARLGSSIGLSVTMSI